jgi:hypothetical protein
MPWSGLYTWIACRRIGAVVNPDQATEIGRSWMDEWQLNKIITEVFKGLGMDQAAAERGASLVKLLVSYGAAMQTQGLPEADTSNDQKPVQLLQSWLRDAELQRLLGFNRYQSILWFNKESFEEWVWWVFTSAVIDLANKPDNTLGMDSAVIVSGWYELIQRLRQAARSSEYQVEKLLEAAKGN